MPLLEVEAQVFILSFSRTLSIERLNALHKMSKNFPTITVSCCSTLREHLHIFPPLEVRGYRITGPTAH